MCQPAITIITPNYNSGQKLSATLDSVRAQQAKVEYLVIDGQSTDESLAIARSFERKNPDWTRVVSQKDLGVYDAMNRGITLAKGRYLYFLGAGDLLYPGVLSHIVDSLPADDRTLVYGNMLWKDRRYDGRFSAWKLRGDNLPHQAAFYGRDIFQIVGTYELKYKTLADWALNLAIFGDRRIRRKYVDVLVAAYEGGGLSDRIADDAFISDRAMLLRRLGWRSALYARVHARLAVAKRRVHTAWNLILNK